MKVCFGLSSHDDLKTNFAMSMLPIDWCGCDVVIRNVRVPYLPKSRHMLARAALEVDCDALLLIDSDMEFPRDGFKRLLSHEKDIVGTFYRMRQPPYEVVGNWGTEDDTSQSEGFGPAQMYPSGFLAHQDGRLQAHSFAVVHE